MPVRTLKNWLVMNTSIGIIVDKCVRAPEAGNESQCFIFMTRTGLCLWEAQRGRRVGQNHTALASDQELFCPGFLLLLVSQPLLI